MALPYDLMFLGSFVYAGYRTLGRWFKFAEDDARHRRGAWNGVALPKGFCGFGWERSHVEDRVQRRQVLWR